MTQATQLIRPRPSLAGRIARSVLPLLVLGFALGLWQRERLWVWYCTERMERAADDESRTAWGEKLAVTGEPAIGSLLALLRHDEPAVCLAAKSSLAAMTVAWPADDQRRISLAERFFDAEPRFSTPGRSAALDLVPDLLRGRSPELKERARGMIATAAKSESVDIRVQAIAAALRPDVDCLEAVSLLLGDDVPEVRRAAVLALGAVRDGGRAPAVSDDELLRCLHDSDAEVRRLGEMSLRGRGRSPRDIRLGKRYAAPNPAERSKLLLDLADEDELDVTVWLERLTSDADPAVRAGAAKVAWLRNADLSGRLAQLSQSDPDSTVRRIAEYYRQMLATPR